MAIVTRAGKGEALTHEELDNNFTELDGKIDALQSPVTVKTEDLEAGANTITHGTGKKARMVTFFLSTGMPTNYMWYRNPEDEYNSIIVEVPEGTSESELLSTEINILTK